MNYFWLGLGLSIIIHISQYTTLLWYDDARLKTKQNAESVIEIDLTETPSAAERPIIKTPDAPTQPETPDQKPAAFFSDKTQRVKEQSQARLKGIQKNSSASQASRPTQPLKSLQPKYEFENAVQGDLSFDRPKNVESGKISNNQWVYKSQNSGPSQFEYQLTDDIQFGEITALDTDTHIYASFYNRIVDLFYVRWISQLDSIWARLSSETKSSLSSRIWRTDVEIVIDKDGLYKTGKILRSSGFNPFDQAAIAAFKSAQVFPNPPRGKIDPDGMVRFRLRVGVSVN